MENLIEHYLAESSGSEDEYNEDDYDAYSDDY
jgi:hypothetical protein